MPDGNPARFTAHERVGFLIPDRVGRRSFTFTIAPPALKGSFLRATDDEPQRSKVVEVLQAAVERATSPRARRASLVDSTGLGPDAEPHQRLAHSIRRFVNTYIQP